MRLESGNTISRRQRLALRPCGVVQSTRLPLMQEITGAKPVRDATFTALKALSAMHSLGKRISPVQLRVRTPVLVAVRKDRNRASAQAGFISQLCRGQHSGLRPLLRLRLTTVWGSQSKLASEKFFGRQTFCGCHFAQVVKFPLHSWQSFDSGNSEQIPLWLQSLHG